MRINEDHELPTVRIHKVVLDNFKSIEHGEVVFSCAKQFVPYGSRSDILGIYGQNGSGKTSFIEALSIIRFILSGRRVPDAYSECIMSGKEFASIEITFDFQYPNGMIRKVIYSCSLSAVKKDDQTDHNYDNSDDHKKSPFPYRVKVYNETLSASGPFNGNNIKQQPIITTKIEGTPFGPVSKQKYYIGKNKNIIPQLEAQKILADERSSSFIFSSPVLDEFKKNSDYSDFYQVLTELNLYAEYYLVVVDTKSTGYIRLNSAIPIMSRIGRFTLGTLGNKVMPQDSFNLIHKIIGNMSIVLSQIVPGLNISLKALSPALTDDGTPGQIAELVSIRNGVELPIRAESDGVRKIISTLNLIIDAFNDQSITVAIDEFDDGVFEYLLGEILQSLEESGKGQFIFTSHNLRPLEVINKDFICFTTTNPSNRYFRLSHIGNSNNLRDVYYREIIMGEQDEEVYSRTKRYKMVSAFRKVGASNGKQKA